MRLSQGRVAHSLLLALPGNKTVWFANTHLHHSPTDAGVRLEQVERILEWLDAAPAADATIVAGDFNTPPFEPAYAAMSERHRSAFLEANGAEPAVTWPSGLQAPTMDLEGDPNCLDYI